MPEQRDAIPAYDGALATSLAAAPAWAPWLSEVNQLLTTFSLAIGLALGAARLWLFLKERRSK